MLITMQDKSIVVLHGRGGGGGGGVGWDVGCGAYSNYLRYLWTEWSLVIDWLLIFIFVITDDVQTYR